MEKRVQRLGYDVTLNPPGDGNFFYASAEQSALTTNFKGKSKNLNSGQHNLV